MHYKFQDGDEMAEEYNLDTNIILRRAWKRGKNLSKKSEWDIEVGDPEPDSLTLDTIGLKENSNSVCTYFNIHVSPVYITSLPFENLKKKISKYNFSTLEIMLDKFERNDPYD